MENDKMKVKVFIDVLWMETFLLYWMFLLLTHLMTQNGPIREKKRPLEHILVRSKLQSTIGRRILRIAIGAAVGATVQILQIVLIRQHIFFVGVMLDVCKLVLMLTISWKHSFTRMKNLRKICLEGSCFTLLCFVFGGAWRAISVSIRGFFSGKKMQYSTASLLIMSILLCLLLFGGIYMVKHKNDLSCVVELHLNQQVICVNALIDTGNSLKNPLTGQPVSVVEKKVFSKYASALWVEKNKLCCIPYKTIGKSGILWGIHIPMMKILKGEEETICKNPIIAFYDGTLSGKREYQMILNPDMFCDG